MNSTTSLYISELNPDNGVSNVKLDSTVNVTFNRAINKGTLAKNILVLEDLSKDINDINEISYKPYNVVKGSIRCNERTVEFIPSMPLNIDSRYVIYIRRNISSIYGDMLMQDKLYSFNTTITESKYKKPVITYPEDKSIINVLNNIDFTIDSNDFGAYVQVATDVEFSNVAFEYNTDTTINCCYVDKILEDNSYYIRVKSLFSEWCEPIQIYIQKLNNSPVSIDDLYSVEDIEGLLNDLGVDNDNVEDEISYEVFPKGKISHKISNILITFNKLLNVDQVNKISITKIFDKLLDEQQYEDIVFNSYSICHDEELNKTHLVIHLGK